MTLLKRIAVAGIAGLTGVVLLMTSPASAAGPKMIQLAGVGAFDSEGVCTELPSLFTMTMTGDLVGCWYTDTIDYVSETPSGVYQERGTETFVGCTADGSMCGTFSTTYKFTAKFAEDGSQLHGRCQHPIVSGTGDFAGIAGRLDFKDDVEAGVALYRGHLKVR